MSQFDYPRINFSGTALINPASANNNVHLPLVLYDSIQAQPVMPPRIYLNKDLQALMQMGGLPLPAGTPILQEESEPPYFELSTVNAPEIFKQWITTPLGESPFDTAYHPCYEIIHTEREKIPLKGRLPASWNYYGGMEFIFDDVKVHSAEILSEKNERVVYSEIDSYVPPEFNEILDCRIELKTERGQPSAVIIDVIPTLAFYTQIFCDSFQVTNGKQVFFKGRPLKASLRFLNPDRVVNEERVRGGSGTFFCVIPMNHLEEGEHSPVMDFFLRHNRRKEKINGVFIRYNLSEVQQNDPPDYRALGQKGNPAKSKVTGSISPWYEGEMKSTSMARQMISIAPFLGRKSFPPIAFQYNKARHAFSIDLVGAIPQLIDKKNNSANYSTYPFGEAKLKLTLDDGSQKEIGTLMITDEGLSQKNFHASGGIVDFPLGQSVSIADAEANSLSVYGASKKDASDAGQEVLLMHESEFMVASDQTGMYLNQFDDPVNGYASYSHEKEPCEVRIFRRGKPYKGSMQMTIMELRIKSSVASAEVTKFLETNEFTDGTRLRFAADRAANVMYVMYPGNTYTGAMFLIPDIVRTGFFLNLRILPVHDYAKYLDPNHPEFSGRVPFEVLYKEILEVFDLIYPVSSIVTPFTEEYFKKGWKMVKYRLSPENWNSFSYMPSTRDMAGDKWLLFRQWAEQFESS